jgi:hypothetical protein
MSTKQIQFNPLFLVGGASKTKKKSAPKTAPLISPNILKNKLLKKIKEHKNKEINEQNKIMAEKKKLEKAASKTKTKTLTSFEEEDDHKDITEYTDDFNDSLKYLKSLKKKHDEEEQEKQLIVNLELPEELKEPSFCSPPSPSSSPPSSPPSSPAKKQQSSSTSYVAPPPPPWGILKNGTNPTYRQYNNKTLKNNTTASITTTTASITTPTLISERESKLQEIRNKTKQENNSSFNPASSSSTKQTIKRTIRRKYLLGKSKNKRVVGVLLKDKNTRKQIIQAQKDLKGESINDVKKYLRNHNLIKIGTFAPNDVVRKMYESAMFAGDITNKNEETMLHNFVKDNNEEPIF